MANPPADGKYSQHFLTKSTKQTKSTRYEINQTDETDPEGFPAKVVIMMYNIFNIERRDTMGHKIVEAIIEDGQLKYVDKKLPPGRIKVHIVYDAEEKTIPEVEVTRIVKETSGIYKDIDVASESKKLRENWERNVRN